MENTEGFYKFEDDLLQFAPNFVCMPGDINIFIENKNDYEYPINGWFYFQNYEAACIYFNLPIIN